MLVDRYNECSTPGTLRVAGSVWDLNLTFSFQDMVHRPFLCEDPVRCGFGGCVLQFVAPAPEAIREEEPPVPLVEVKRRKAARAFCCRAFRASSRTWKQL